MNSLAARPRSPRPNGAFSRRHAQNFRPSVPGSMNHKLWVGLLLGVSACGSGSSVDAKTAFWDAFTSGDLAGVAAARDLLIAEADTTRDSEVPRLIGMSYLTADNPMESMVGIPYLEKAVELNP